MLSFLLGTPSNTQAFGCYRVPFGYLFSMGVARKPSGGLVPLVRGPERVKSTSENRARDVLSGDALRGLK